MTHFHYIMSAMSSTLLQLQGLQAVITQLEEKANMTHENNLD